jgi:predicted nuclease of predicted toxin-antitoxin system
MRLLLDECVPRRLSRDFVGHSVSTIEQAGLKGLKNGSLLLTASERFDVLITVDKNIEYQQNKDELPMPILVLSAFTNRYESVSALVPAALQKLLNIERNEIVTIKE